MLFRAGALTLVGLGETGAVAHAVIRGEDVVLARERGGATLGAQRSRGRRGGSRRRTARSRASRSRWKAFLWWPQSRPGPSRELGLLPGVARSGDNKGDGGAPLLTEAPALLLARRATRLMSRGRHEPPSRPPQPQLNVPTKDRGDRRCGTCRSHCRIRASRAHGRPPRRARADARHRRHRADLQLQGQPHRHRRPPVLLEGPARDVVVVLHHAPSGQARRGHRGAGPRHRLRGGVGGAPLRARADGRLRGRCDATVAPPWPAACACARSAGSLPIPRRDDEVLLHRPRLSRIYYKRHFFPYPIGITLTVARRLGLLNTALIGAELHEGAAVPEAGRDVPRRVLRQPLRPAPLRDVLPRLHGEGVGRALRRDPRRLGRPAREGPLAQEGRRARGEGPPVERLPEGAAGARDEPHHALLLPEVRARPDVGDRRGRDHEGRRRDPARLLRRRRQHRRRSRDRGGGRGSGDGRALAHGLRLLLLDDAREGAREADHAGTAGGGARGRRTGSCTATSSPSGCCSRSSTCR